MCVFVWSCGRVIVWPSLFFQPDVAIETFYTMDPAILTSADWHKSQQAWQAAKDAGKRTAFDSAATATAAYRIVSGVHAQPSRRWTEDGSTSVLPANHVRPHNVKGEAAVAPVKDVVASHVWTWASETVSSPEHAHMRMRVPSHGRKCTSESEQTP